MCACALSGKTHEGVERRGLTYAAAIEHQVPRAAVAQAPAYGSGTEDGDDAVQVRQR